MIEELLIQLGCGRDVMSHHVFFFFFFNSLTLSCAPDREHLSLNNGSHFGLPSSPPAKTRYQAVVSVEPDATETRPGHLFQLSRPECSGETDQSALTTYTPLIYQNNSFLSRLIYACLQSVSSY